jgi:hypothetical protein
MAVKGPATAFILLLATFQPADAQSVGRGVGTATCAEFARFYRDDPTELVFVTWAQGFMTGWNFAARTLGGKERNLSATGIESQEFVIRSHCDKHPLQLYVQAVMALYFSLPELPPRAAKSSPPSK